MINLQVDEAYAFDYLCILQIKSKLTVSDQANFSRCREVVSQQVGIDHFLEIVHSLEYKNLLNANQEVFNIVEEIRAGKDVSSKALDEANMSRYFAKRDLQRKFFNNEITETKTNEKIFLK